MLLLRIDKKKILTFALMNSEAFMKRYLGISAWAVALLLSACSSVNTLYFDQLEAADVSFPEVVRKVGIINNMP